MPRHENDGLRKRCACGRRKWTSESCRHPWHGNFSHDGVEYRASLHKVAGKPRSYHMLKGEAERVLRDWQSAVENGRIAVTPDPAPAVAAPEPTLRDLAREYRKWHIAQPTRRPTAATEMGRQVDQWVNATITLDGRPVTLGDLPLSQITRRVVLEWRAHRAASPSKRAQSGNKGGAVGTNRLLTRLRHMFALAIENDLTDVSPFVRNGRTVIALDSRAEEPRRRRLNDGEEARLREAAGPHLWACIECALETGMRRGEILGLTWGDVHVSRGEILLPATLTKTGKARTVPISSRLAAVLAMRRTGPDGIDAPSPSYVFGNECGERIRSIKTAWKLTCQRAGIVGLHFHDLRRESASLLLAVPGATVNDVRELLGHRDITTTTKYLSTTIARLRDLAEQSRQPRTTLAQNDESALPAPRAESALPTANLLH